VFGLLIVALIVAVTVTLRSKARSQGMSVSNYVRESVAQPSAKDSQPALTPVPLGPTSTQTDLQVETPEN